MLSFPLVAAIAIAIIANAGAASLSTSTKWPSTVASAVPTQIHISYTQVPYELAVDFVSQDASGYVAFGTTAGGPFTTRASTSFNFSTIGFMHQAVMSFQDSAVGFYKVGSASNESALFAVTLTPTRAERFAVIGDFGLRHDECMADLVQGAAAGAFDSVIHVGDWSYNFEDAGSSTGNAFMTLMQGYAATKPVMPACGNHEACGDCLPIAELPLSAGNFTQYRARMHAVSLNSNTGNNIFYSFDRGLTHFIVFSAEAYLYARSEVFLANQLAFIKADLAAVDRRVTPWVVGAVHKDWTMAAEAFAAFSPVLEAGGVDVTFVGHVHYYNRYMPYNPMTNNIDTAAVSADGGTYTDAKWMVTIVTGAAGNHEDEKAYTKEPPSYTGVENYGAWPPSRAPPPPPYALFLC